MQNMLYFAYGSNMLRERLDARCPHIRFEGVATLVDYRLMFDQYSRVDDSGKGGIEAAPGHVVHGVLWSLPLAELPALDRAESRGEGYERMPCALTHAEGHALEAMTYEPLDIRAGLRPWDWYLNLVIAGAEQHGLPQTYVAGIRQMPSKQDPEHNRPARLAGLDALTRVGFSG